MSGVTGASYSSSTTVSISFTPGAADTNQSDYVVQLYTDSGCTSAEGSASVSGSSSPISVVASGDGEVYACVKSTDLSGRQSALVASNKITVDTTAPAAPTSITITEPSPLSATTINVTFTKDTDTNIDTTTLRACSGGCGGTCVGDTTVSGTSATISGLSNNTTYVVCGKSTDLASLESAYAASAGSIVIDQTLPTAPASITNAAYSAVSSVSVSWPAGSDNYSLDGYLADYCDSDCSSNCTGSVDVAGTSHTFTGFSSGDVKCFRVSSKDSATNVSGYTTGSTTTFDFVNPVAPNAPTITESSPSNSQTINFSWTGGSDALTSINYVTDVCTTDCSTGCVSQSTVASSPSSRGSLSDGTYIACVATEDAAGNRSAFVASSSIVIDTVAPGAFSVSSPSDTATIASTTPTITWGSSTDASDYNLVISSTSDCNTAVQTHNNVVVTSKALTTLANDGTYYVCVTAVDAATNSTAATTTSFVLETSTLHVSYSKSGAVHHATKSGVGSWTLTTVDTDGSILARNSMALDSSNNATIAYSKSNGTAQYLYYAGGASFATKEIMMGTTLVAGDHGGNMVSVAIDSGDDVVATYRLHDDSATNAKRLLSFTSGTYTASWAWTDTTLATNDEASVEYYDSSIALDTGNNPNAFYTYYNGSNYLAKSRPYASSTWQAEESITPSDCTDIAYLQGEVDGSDLAHVVLYCFNSADNNCHTIVGDRGATSWTATGSFNTIESAGSCSTASLTEANRPSIHLASSGCSHIAYMGAAGVRYATDCSGSWATSETVSATGSEPTIVLDSDNLPYIFFMDSGALKMVSKNSGSWSSAETIDATGVVAVGTGAVNGVKGRSN